jgi:hypothetical protein
VGGALVKLSQNAMFTYIPVALVRHYELSVDFYVFSLILRILLIQLFLFYSTIRRISLCFYEFY